MTAIDSGALPSTPRRIPRGGVATEALDYVQPRGQGRHVVHCELGMLVDHARTFGCFEIFCADIEKESAQDD